MGERLYADHGPIDGLGYPLLGRDGDAMAGAREPALGAGRPCPAAPCDGFVTAATAPWGLCVSHIEALPDELGSTRHQLQQLYRPGAREQSADWYARQAEALAYLNREVAP